jgi:hypothetical protein
MAGKWEVSPEFPEGHLVPLTPEEEAQAEADRVAGTVVGAAEEATKANQRTLDQRLSEQLPILKAAIDAMTASPPTLFAGLNNQERVFLRRVARNQADIIRLVLRLLDSTD